MLLVFACAPQQPAEQSTTLKVPAPSLKNVTIQDVVDNPNKFVDVKIQVTGKLIFTGKNYFSDPKFAISDGTNNFPVFSWLPLEVPPPFPGSEGKSRPLVMSDYLNKMVTVQGTIKKSNEQFYLDVIEATVIEQPKSPPTIAIVSPRDNDLIKSSKVTVQVGAENFNLVPVGEPVKDEEGHFHVWLDSEKKLGPQNTFTFENVVSGKHSVVAELVKSDHSSLTPKVTKSISINVESDYIPPKPVQQQRVAEFSVESDDKGFYPGTLKAKIGDKVIIHFKFRDDSIYFAGLDVKGPFDNINYKLKGEQPVTREFTMKEETRITSWWPASGVKKATLTVEVAK